MKPLYLIAASALALTAAACGPKTPVARAALDCPTNQGDLTRTSASADGKICTYTTSGGAEVTLQLVSVQGGVDSTLSAIETNLLANRVKPDPNAKPKDGEAAKDGDKAKASAEQTVHDEVDREVERAVAEATADASDSGVHVEVSKDGKSSVVTEDGGTTRVNLPGIHIVANENDDTAKVRVGPISVDAGGDGATVRMRRDVRLRGEQLNPEKRGMRAMFLYTGDDLPNGYRYVGYEAGGPKRGPITVAVVRSKSEGPHDGDEIYSDVKRLVRMNGGV